MAAIPCASKNVINGVGRKEHVIEGLKYIPIMWHWSAIVWHPDLLSASVETILKLIFTFIMRGVEIYTNHVALISNTLTPPFIVSFSSDHIEVNFYIYYTTEDDYNLLLQVRLFLSSILYLGFFRLYSSLFLTPPTWSRDLFDFSNKKLANFFDVWSHPPISSQVVIPQQVSIQCHMYKLISGY